MMPITEVHALYKQWQDGKLLDSDEQKALNGSPKQPESQLGSFSEALKLATETNSNLA
jgi:hypothetical protein